MLELTNLLVVECYQIRLSHTEKSMNMTKSSVILKLTSLEASRRLLFRKTHISTHTLIRPFYETASQP